MTGPCFRTRLAVFIVLLILSVCLAANAKSDEVYKLRIKSEATVTGETILLKDVCEFLTDEEDFIERIGSIKLGASASPGKTKTITVASIKVRLRQRSLDSDIIDPQSPEKVVVTTDFTMVTADDIRAAVQTLVMKEVPWPAEDVSIEVKNLPDQFYLPKGDVNIEFNPSPAVKYLGSLVIPVRLKINGSLYKVFGITCYIKVYSTIVVAVRDIKRGEIISESSLALDKRDISGLHITPETDIAAVVGKRTTKAVMIGQPLNKNDLENVPVVLKGQKITAKAMIGSIEVTVIVEARQDGCVGDLIKVKNVDSKEEFLARVVEPGLVLASGDNR